MHVNFHLSGDETPEQSRRIANAVLALGGAQLVPDDEVNIKLDATPELMAFFNGQADHPRKGPQTSTKAGEMHVEVNIDTTNASFGVQPDGIVTEKGKEPRLATMDEMLEAGHHVTQGSGRYAESGGPRFHVVNLETGSTILPTAMTIEEMRECVAPSDVPIVAKPLPPALPVPTSSAVAPSGLDAKGLPWDERIHSSSRAINADGTWRYRKNVPDETKQAVEAELRGAITVGQKVEVPEVPSLNADLTNIVAYAGAKAVPVPPIPSVAPPVPVSTVQRSYSDVVNLIMANQSTLNKPELYVAVLGMSLPEFAAACIAKPELATVAFNALDEIRRA